LADSAPGTLLAIFKEICAIEIDDVISMQMPLDVDRIR